MSEPEIGSLDTLATSTPDSESDDEALALARTASLAQSSEAQTPPASTLAMGLAHTAASDADELPAAAADAARDGLPSVQRQHYRLQDELARGGMGRIIRAEDRRLGRPVAIKELLKASPLSRARFEREALITARLQHPAIVPLYEAGRWPDGEPFFAMKMVAGSPLDEVVKSCATLAERLALLPRVIDVADALAYAHSRGVIHRDLKPANVLVGDYGETVVIDWGLAKRSDEEDEESVEEQSQDEARSGPAPLTIMGQAMGTPAYMPPEQARGESVDARADVYSLGAMLYHVLGGKMAYANSKSAEEILSRVLKGPPRALDTISAGIPADLLTIVNKAMARDPDERYPDASDFAEELRRFQAGKLVAAHSYSVRTLIWRWIRKHRSTVASASVLLCLLASFAVWSFQQLRQERDGAMKARHQAMVERKAAVAKSLQLALNYASRLARSEPLRALDELAGIRGLAQQEALVERARVIAAQARSSRIPMELTRSGNDHGLVAVSTDNSLVAIAWHNRRIALIELPSKAVQILPGPVVPSARAIAFSPTGAHLVVAGKNRQAHLWDMRSQEAPIDIETRGFISQVAFSPNGRWLALRQSGRVELFDLEATIDADNRKTISFYHSADMAFSPDSSTIAVAADHAITFDLESGETTELIAGRPQVQFEDRYQSFSKIAYSPDGKRLIVADERVLSIDLASGQASELFSATEDISALALADDGDTLAAGSLDTIVYVYRFGLEKDALNTLTGHEQAVNWLSFTNGNRGLASAGTEGQLRLWHLTWVQRGNILWSRSSETLSSTLSSQPPIMFADGSKVMAYDRTKVLRLWDRERPDVQAIGDELWGSHSVFAIGDRRMLWSLGGPDHGVRVRDASGNEEVIGDHGEQIEIVAISSDDRYGLSGGARMLRLWNLQDKSSVLLVGHESDMRYAAFVRGGLLTSDFKRGTLWFWDLESGKGRTIGEHGDILNGMVGTIADPLGRWVATAGLDKKVYLHSIAEGTRSLLSTAELPVRGMASSVDGSMLVMSLRKGEISVFYPGTDKAPRTLRSPDSSEILAHPAMAPNGRTIAASNGVTGIRIWKNWREGGKSDLLLSLHETWFPSFSADSKRITAPGKPQGMSSVWHVETGERRDMHGHEGTGKAAFWPAADALVVSSWGGLMHMWRDDLPRDWKGLHAWIEEQRAIAMPGPAPASGP